MLYPVVFTPEAEEQLTALYRYIAVAASANTAQRYISALITYCEGFQTFPHRGTRRDDIRTGLRITNYKGRVVIAFEVNGGASRHHRCVLWGSRLRGDLAVRPG
jgi:plasmid stabilization system protein ParE